MAIAGRRLRRSLAPLLAVVAASVIAAGCCRQVISIECIDWAEGPSCPSPEVAERKLEGDVVVTGKGTYWPEHTYVIEGVSATERAACCYQVEATACAGGELH